MGSELDTGRGLVSVLDMRASAIRLVVAEVARGEAPRVVDEAHETATPTLRSSAESVVDRAPAAGPV